MEEPTKAKICEKCPLMQGPDAFRIEFVSYDGDYPNRCSGNLVLRVNGVEVEFPKYCLSSGGGITPNYEGTWKGPWTVDTWPNNFPEAAKLKALEVINDNVHYGCCGGCI